MRWQRMHGRGQTQADTGRLHGCGTHSHPSTRARAEPAPQAPPVLSDRTQECHPCPWRAATPPMTPSFLLGARDTRHIFILCQFLRLPVKTGFGFTRFRVKSLANWEKWQQLVPSLQGGSQHPAGVCKAGSGSPCLCLSLPTSEMSLAWDVWPFFFPFLHAARFYSFFYS